RGIRVQDRTEDASGSSPRAEDQQPLAGQAFSLIDGDITHEADPVGVVAPDSAAGEERQRVHSTSDARLLAQLVGDRERRLLVRHRDIEPLAPCGAEAAHGRLEADRLGIDELVGQPLAGLSCEKLVDQRRAAVLNGVADYPIAIDGCVVLHDDSSDGCDEAWILPAFMYLFQPKVVGCSWRRFDEHSGLPTRCCEDRFMQERPVAESAGLRRCPWSEGVDEAYLCYHDTEWGVPVHDDRKHFEFLVLEAAQAGLSWA